MVELRIATYGASVSSGLSVADPKYFFPAALAAIFRPVEVDMEDDVDDVVDDVDVASVVDAVPWWIDEEPHHVGENKLTGRHCE